MLTVPSLRNAFNFGPVTVLQAAAAVAASVAGVAWFEVYKLVAIRRR
jgi:Ca2+-transporting ATPase